MTREEKAQAHDEALERARKLHSEYRTIVGTNIPEEIFPELKESEDVMWRNWLIGHLVGYINQTNHKYAKVCKEAITWLKKQGESDETKAKRFLINKGYPIDTNGTIPTYEEIYDIIKMGFEEQGNKSVNIDIESMISSYKQRLKSQGGIENSPLVKKELKKISPKTLDPDKVIEWISNQACLGFIEDIEVEKFVEQFKIDLGL